MCPDTHLGEAPKVSPPIGAFTNTYAALPPRFFSEQRPAQVAAPRLVRFNDAAGPRAQPGCGRDHASGAGGDLLRQFGA